MSSALHALDAKVASIVQRGGVLGLHGRQFVEHGLAIARAVHQQLSARVETNQEILVTIVAGLNEVGQSIASAPDLIAAHRSGNVKENSNRHRSVFIAKEGNFLRRFLIENREEIFAETRNKTAVDVGHGYIECDQIRVDDDWI